MAAWTRDVMKKWLDKAEAALASLKDPSALWEAMKKGKQHPFLLFMDRIEELPFPDVSDPDRQFYKERMTDALGSGAFNQHEDALREFIPFAQQEVTTLLRYDVQPRDTMPASFPRNLAYITEGLQEVVTDWRGVYDAFSQSEEANPRLYETFTWKGVKFVNEGWTEPQVREVLDALEWVMDLFKRRGLAPLLKQGLKRVVLQETRDGFDDSSADGWYDADTKEIRLTPDTRNLKTMSRFLKNWQAEVFLHEFGHHVHMSLLPRAAKEFWDSGWDFVHEALERTAVLTLADRRRFVDLLTKQGFDAQAAGRRLKGLDRLKYLGYLRQLGWIQGGKQVRLTPYGKEVVAYIQHIEQTGGSGSSEFKSWFNEALRLDDSSAHDIPEDLVDQIRAQDRSVDEALDALGIPSEYGKTDLFEDFAETFVEFMVHPERLSSVARWRMGRTLGLSDAHGQRIIKLTRVASLVKQFLQEA